MDGTSDFRFGATVLDWLDRLLQLHGDQSEFLDTVVEKVKTSSETLLHYGALGLRGIVYDAANNGECTRAFQQRADAVLWGLEVLADDDSRFGLPSDVVISVVEVALAQGDDDLASVAPVVEIADRV